MAERTVELKVNVSKVVTLVEEEVITKEEGKALLNQFSKEDLIQDLLEEDSDDEDLDDYDDEPEVEEPEIEVEKKEESEVIDEEDDAPLTSDEEDEFEDLLS